MRMIVCPTCMLALRVEGTDDQELDTLIGKGSPFFPDNYECPQDGCVGKAKFFDSLEMTPRAIGALRIVDVTPGEAFAALNGVGLPEERSCLIEDVRDLLSKGVKRVSGKNLLGTSRCIIDFIEIEDGSKIYLAPSGEGVTVYRTTRPFSYAARVGGTDGG
jgi:hypothetical protein